MRSFLSAGASTTDHPCRLQVRSSLTLRARGANAKARRPVGQPLTLSAEAFETDGLGELGAEAIAGNPLHDGVRPLAAARQDQPDAGAHFELPLGDGHEAPLGNVEHGRLD